MVYLIVFLFVFQLPSGTCKLLYMHYSKIFILCQNIFIEHTAYDMQQKKQPEIAGCFKLFMLHAVYCMFQHYAAGASSDAGSVAATSSTAETSSVTGAAGASSTLGASFLGSVKAFTLEASISFFVIKRF